MYKNNLDGVNNKIINILLEDGRISLTDLSKKVGISRGLVANRIKDLENSEVIKKFTVLVSPEYFRKPLPVFFDIKVAPEYLIESAKILTDYDDIVVVYQMSGNSALHVHGYFEDINEVYSFIDQKLNTLAGIQDIQTQFLLKKFKSDFV